MGLTAAVWVESVKREDKVRLKWFLANQEKLVKQLEEPLEHVDYTNDLAEARKKIIQSSERHPRIKTEDVVPVVEGDAVTRVMRPVAPEITNLLYTSANVGRKLYLGQRVKDMPEKRFYYPMTTSHVYGWNMFDCAKTMEGSKFGRSAIIKQSFYRRRAGVQADPNWYIQPAKLSPTVCTG